MNELQTKINNAGKLNRADVQEFLNMKESPTADDLSEFLDGITIVEAENKKKVLDDLQSYVF